MVKVKIHRNNFIVDSRDYVELNMENDLISITFVDKTHMKKALPIIVDLLFDEEIIYYRNNDNTYEVELDRRN